MNIYDEVNMLMEQLTTAWGNLVIECDSHSCLVSDKDAYNRNLSAGRVFEAPTMIEALRLAAEKEGVT